MPIIMMAAIAVLEVKMQASGSHQTCFVYFAKRERDSNSSTSCEALTRHYLGQIPLPPTPAINMYRRLQCNIKAKDFSALDFSAHSVLCMFKLSFLKQENKYTEVPCTSQAPWFTCSPQSGLGFNPDYEVGQLGISLICRDQDPVKSTKKPNHPPYLEPFPWTKLA